MTAELKTTTMRLRSVRFKDGRAPIRVFRAPPPDKSVSENFAACAKRCLETSVSGPAMTGWALVAWTNDEVFVNYENGLASRVPASGLPRYVADILLAEQAVRWSGD